MDQDQRIHGPLGDKPRGDDRLAEGRDGRQDSGLVREHRPRGRLLLRSQRTLKCHIQRASLAATVVHVDADTQAREDVADLLEATARETDVTGVSSAQAITRGLS